MNEIINISKVKLYYKSYYERNKDNIKKRNNIYYYKNIDNIKKKARLQEKREARKIYNKQYTLDNRVKKQLYYEEYYKVHKEEIIKRQSEKIGCRTCRCMVGIQYFKKHITSNKHKYFLTVKNNIDMFDLNFV